MVGLYNRAVVQLVEQRSPKPPVVGSNPACPDIVAVPLWNCFCLGFKANPKNVCVKVLSIIECVLAMRFQYTSLYCCCLGCLGNLINPHLEELCQRLVSFSVKVKRNLKKLYGLHAMMYCHQ